MTKLTNPFDSTGHRLVLTMAILLLIISIGTALTPPPVTTEATSFGKAMGDSMGSIFLTLLAAGIACAGLAISASAMRVVAGKKKTPINKQATWYLLFYFIVLILPVAFLAIGA
jgi:hypothetical protein